MSLFAWLVGRATLLIGAFRTAQTDRREDSYQCEGEAVDEEDEEGRQRWFRSMWEGQADDRPKQETQFEEYNDDEDAGDDFGDDFDEFAEGDEDNDFGDFDEAEEQKEAPPQPSQVSSQPTPPDILADLVSSNAIIHHLNRKLIVPASSRH